MAKGDNTPMMLAGWGVRSVLVYFAAVAAYNIRLYAIKDYGLVIHEFDPWFNYRATEYLAEHGYRKFFQWFDYMSWYPLGRPVGTTIYPGMQFTSVFIHYVLNNVFGKAISLNDVCCLVPAWFGVLATLFLGALTAECSRSANAGVAAAFIMAIIPAHIMRSVGGGYDNESIAVTAMCATFYFWCRSLRTEKSWPVGIATGVAYIYMVAAWGGYIFVLNLIGVHALVLVCINRYTTNLYWAYTLFYVIGTAGAIQVPVVGWSPLKSLEQLGPCAVFLLIQAIELCQRLGHRLGHAGDAKKMWALRVKVFAVAGAGALLVIAMLWPTGYFGPFSSRIRSLFVKHTRTGNPLVDSVAEHQPASEEAYQHYLKDIYYIAPYGLLIALFCHWNDGSRFLVLYAVVAYVFSKKMMRLIILTGPIASALGGVALAGVFDWSVVQLQAEDPTAAAAAKRAKAKAEAEKAAQAVTDSLVEETVDVGKDGKKAAARAKAAAKNRRQNAKVQKKAADSMWTQLANGWDEVYNSQQVVHGRKAASVVLLAMLLWGVVGRGPDFYDYCHAMAKQMSHPSILFKATLRDGTPVVVDDYREAYWWLRDNTPPDARVMAWWDYGYQIAGIANRTTIADGNTWNHEHIATLGRCLTSPEKEAHRIIRHLADYVLIWTGGGGDDLAKSPHMARIGTSVYDDICPGDPTCRQFGMMQSGQPTPMMAASLLYKLHGHNQVPGIQADPNRFKEVYTSKFNKVRIFEVLKVSKDSKKWAADAANRKCDAPGSWYCEGTYPPGLDKLMVKKKAFQQLEDFNKKSDGKSTEKTQQYMDSMNGKRSPEEERAWVEMKRQQWEESEQKKTADADAKKTDKKRKADAKLAKAKADEAKAAEAAKAAATAADAYDAEGDEFDDDYDDVAEPAAQVEQQQQQQQPRRAAALEAAAAAAESENRANWRDTEVTSQLWNLVNGNAVDQLSQWIASDPVVVHMRAADGRGPLFWAHEYGRKEIIALLVAAGASEEARDNNGDAPHDMA